MGAKLRGILPLARKLMAVMREPSYRRALRHGVAAAVEHDAAPFGPAFRTVIDVGANRGQFALVARRRFPAARLICVEPLARPRQLLGRVLAGGGELEVLPVAAAAEDGQADLVVSRSDDSSSLLAMTSLQTTSFPGTGEAARTIVRTARLDGLIDPALLASPVLLKVDVQGSELGVLRGASGLLRVIDEVLVECSFAELYSGQALAWEVVDFMHRDGFALVAVCSAVEDSQGRVLQADLLFGRRGELGDQS
jgi:FkbM family methyltransferase